jgi:hypothetical protein
LIAVDLQAEALFASTVQPSQKPSPAAIDAAVTASLLHHGSDGCAALVAQEFGDHPEAAAERMRWCRGAVHASALAAVR